MEKYASGADPRKTASVTLQQSWRYGNYCRGGLTKNYDLLKNQTKQTNPPNPTTLNQKNPLLITKLQDRVKGDFGHTENWLVFRWGFFSASSPVCITASPLLRSLLWLSVSLSSPWGMLCPVTSCHPFFHGTLFCNQLLVPKRRILTQCFLQPCCLPSKCAVTHTEINNCSYLGALVREKTSCHKLFEDTVSLLPIVLSSLS